MKSFLQNLMILLALCLCGLCAFQWVRETDLRKTVQKLTDDGQAKSQNILDLQATQHRQAEEIQRLDALKNQLNETVKTNRAEIARLSKDLEKLERENDTNRKQAEAYKEAYTTANENVKKQNEDIQKQNATLNRLALERNAAISNLNAMSKVITDIANKWTRMGDDFSKAAPAAQRDLAITNLNMMTSDFNDFATKWNEMQKALQNTATNGTK